MRLVYLALGWTGGLILAALNPGYSDLIRLIWAILILVSAGILVIERRLWAAVLLLFTLGGLRMSFVPGSSALAVYNNSGGLTIEGLVAAEPDRRDAFVQVQIDADTLIRAGTTTGTQGRVLVQSAQLDEAHVGDRLRATGLLIAPAEFDTFSYADYLGRAGVFSVMREASVEVLSHNPGFLGTLARLNVQAAQFIAQALPEPQAGLLTGILLGNERGISPQVSEDFRRVGASHIVAISGFNMVILSGVIIRLLERLFKQRWLAVLIGIAVIAVYTLFVGASPAVIRAALMSMMLVVGQLIRRKTYVPSSLAIVVLLLTAISPTILWDLGFQLSFFATLGLALYADPLSARLEGFMTRWLPSSAVPALGSFLFEPLIVTVAALIMTLPLTLLYFSHLSIVALAVNLLIIPVQAWLLIIGLLAVLIAFVASPIAQILFWFDLVLLSWTIGVVRAFAALPFADAELYVDSRLIALYYFCLIGAAMLNATRPSWALRLGDLIRQRSVTSASVFAGIATIALSMSVFLSRPDTMLHLWLLDIGHSNAILAQTPRGAQILVDGGRFPSQLLTALGDRMPFHDRSIEVLLLTQPDENDTAALSAVLNRYDVGLVLRHGQANLSSSFAELERLWADSPQSIVRAGYRLTTDDGIHLEILHPQAEPRLEDSLDDQALVARLRYGEVSFLLSGDLSTAGQAALLEAGQWPQATVLQVPQHGAAASLDETFLEAVQPQLAILQADKANRQGDPNFDTLAMLGDVPILRSDEMGGLHLWTDGQTLWYQIEGRR